MKRSSLRILMTTDAVGGVWGYATGLATDLCARGDWVALVVMGPPPSRQQIEALADIPRLELQITALALEWMDPEGSNLERAREVLLRIARQFRPDVVHLNGFREGAFAWPVPALVVAHSCVQTWWHACRGGVPRELQWRRYGDNVAAGLAAAAAWVSPTGAFRNQIAAMYQPPKLGRVIANGFTVEGGRVKKGALILGAGRVWDEAKNLNALAACASALLWPLRIAGPTGGPNGASSPAGQGIYLGSLSRSEVIDEMRRAAVFVAPALYEPFGLSVLEAAACGCALVLSDTPSFRELWGGAALFADPCDAGRLSTTINMLCRNKSLRRGLQQAARTRARLYRRSITTAAYQRLYRELRGPVVDKAALSAAPGVGLQP